MATLIPYFLESILCSGILYCFYRIAYFNRQHHQWNRFFLLGTIIVSLIVPFIKIPIPVVVNETTSGVMTLLNVVTDNSTESDIISPIPGSNFNPQLLIGIAYLSASVTLLFLLVKSLIKIISLCKSNPKEKVDNLQMVMTSEKSSPFSFFKTIFWNKKIDRHSIVGERIFNHEKTHVDHLHSIDRLLINTVLTLAWCNPFFWLIKREMILVHEFIADKNAVSDKNPQVFSEMLLMSAFPGATFGVTSSLVTSSIKRRLAMLTTLRKSHAEHLGKWMLLPVMLILLAGFTLRKKEVAKNTSEIFTVMIDAGHGGSAKGATAADGTHEKDLNLLIAKKIKELNRNDHVKIVMSRDNDADVQQNARIEMAGKMKVDAFISIHVNSDPSGQSGMQVMMTKNTTQYAAKSQLLGTLLSQELRKIYTVDGALRKGPADRGIWVLDAPEITYPSILIECGNMKNENDLAFVTSETNQEKIAQHILAAIKLFAENKSAYAPKAKPSAVEIVVEQGKLTFDLQDNKIVKADFSPLAMASMRNIFAGEDYVADGSEIVIVDGMFMSDKLKGKRVTVGKNKKLIVVSTNDLEPLESIIN